MTKRRIFTTEPKALARLYLWLGLVAVITGTLLSLLMRIHRTWPNLAMPLHGAIKPEDYLALVTMHGTLMVFFVLTVVPQSAFPNLVLPAQIGAKGMALPRLNAVAFWITAASLLVLLAAFFVPEGAPIAGWTSYPPLSALAAAGPGQATGMDLWLMAITVFCLAAVLGSVEYSGDDCDAARAGDDVPPAAADGMVVAGEFGADGDCVLRHCSSQRRCC